MARAIASAAPLILELMAETALERGHLHRAARSLERLLELGIETVSSQEMAHRFNLNSAQIRKDLAYFGEFGVRGVGYNVHELRRCVVEILGLDRERRLLIVGAGNLGTALCHYSGCSGGSFLVVGVLDSDPSKIGVQTPAGRRQDREVPCSYSAANATRRS